MLWWRECEFFDVYQNLMPMPHKTFSDDAITAEAGYAPATEPGAIPVATPVPMSEAAYVDTPNIKTYQSPLIAEFPVQQSAPLNNGFIANDPTLSRGPMMMRQCPHCLQESRTRVTTAPAWQTWLAAVSGRIYLLGSRSFATPKWHSQSKSIISSAVT